jgi:hypothetical protein
MDKKLKKINISIIPHSIAEGKDEITKILPPAAVEKKYIPKIKPKS